MIFKRAPLMSFASAIALVVVGHLGMQYLMPAVRQEPWTWLLVILFYPAFYLGVILFFISLVYWVAVEIIHLLRSRKTDT